ncbi:MAG: DUF1631 family protein [Panacagrimonas sp.]
MKATETQASTSTAATPAQPAAGKTAEDTLALVEDLRSLAVEVLGKGIERMFDGADDMLFEMARRATNNKDQRVYFDTMRVVRLGRPKIGRIFREEIAKGFNPAVPDDEETQQKNAEVAFENLSMQASKSVEESIAISNMATKAEGLYTQLLFELNRRIDWLIKDRRAPIAATALAPVTISNAFRKSAEALDVEFEVEIVIFKLFDRLVISDLGELYTRALRFFEQRGVGASKIIGIPPRALASGGMIAAGSGPIDPAIAAAATAAGMVPTANGYGFTSPPMMDATTLNTLRGMGSIGSAVAPTATGIAYYSDSQLSADLAAAASGQVVPGWEAPRAYAYVQRAGVVGRMFNEILEDPTLPVTLKPRFDQLRFAVIKSALRDTSFFADRRHPVRGLMNELATMAAQARASGVDALKRIEELVGQIQSQFDIAAESIHEQQNALPGPVDEKTLEDFFFQQKDEARGRRQAIIDKTRRIVAEELQLQTLSRRIPDDVWPLLNSGWAPLMALRLLKQGPDSPAWKDGLDLLRRLLDSTDPRRPDARGLSVCEALANDLDKQLRDIGMLPERVAALIRCWQDALVEMEQATLLRASTDSAPSASVLSTDEIPILGFANKAGQAVPTVSGRMPPSLEPAAPEPAPTVPPAETAEDEDKVPDAVTLMDLLMVLSSWFRVYDHDRAQNRWLKVVSHHPTDGTVSFAEFNGQNKLQMRTQVFLDDLVANRAEPIDLGPAARRALEAYLNSRRADKDMQAAGMPSDPLAAPERAT